MLLLLAGCNSSRLLMEEAQQYEDAGMYSDAMDRYVELYDNNKTQVEAHISMKRVGQLLVDEVLLQARSKKALGDYDAAMDMYDQAHDISKKYAFLELTIPSQFAGFESELKAAWINDLYNEAEALVLREQYDEADKYINQIFRLDRDNQRAEYLSIMSELYPNYNKGKKAYELGLYREAHAFFQTVSDLDADFKDTPELMADCRDRCSFSVAYVPIHRNRIEQSVEVAVGTHIKDEILSAGSPFVRLLERENLDQLIEEQRQNMGAAFDEEKAVEAGMLEGAQYVLTGEFLKYTNTLGRQNYDEKKGYDGRTLFSNKVRYSEYSRERTIDASFKYQLINVETGQIHASGNIPIFDRDLVEYVVYEGNHERLHAGNWKSRIVGSRIDVVHSSVEEKADLDRKLNGRRMNKSAMQMELEMVDMIACEVAQKVIDFSPLAQ